MDSISPWICPTSDAECSLTTEGLTIRPLSNDPRISAHVDLPASSGHGIRITTKERIRGNPQFFWAGPGQEFTAERRSDLVLIDGAVADGHVFEASLQDIPLWKGLVTRIRLDPTYLETESSKDGRKISEMTLAEMDKYWEEAKN